VTSDGLAAEPVREARAPGPPFGARRLPLMTGHPRRRVDVEVCNGGMGAPSRSSPLGLAAQLGSVVCGAPVRLARWRSACVGT
jgi:hypothetical protein